MTYCKGILGDNQFLGVNHANQGKARDLYDRFQNADAILAVINSAYQVGVRDFMFTTHDRYTLVFDEIRRSNLFPDMSYTPCLPYAHKYWGKLSEKGLPGMLASTLGQIKTRSLGVAAFSLLQGKTRGIIQLLTEVEILMCKGLPIKGVFLQNLAFDLLVAMELYGVISDFSDVVMRRLGCTPGFITMNHSMAVSVLCDNVGLENPWVCANYNKSGFRMNPSQDNCEASFAMGRSKNIAMSVFASGNLTPSDGLDYVVSRMNSGGVDAILFGSSNAVNIEKNMRKINSGIS
jgi:hypothetical protein